MSNKETELNAEVKTMAPADCREHLFQKIETLRRQLHRQSSFTKRDTLEVSAELDRLILKAMKQEPKNKSR